MKASSTTATEAIQAISDQAAKHGSGERMVRTPVPIRQGDLYLDPCEWPGEGGLTRSSETQLAPGTTKGSRHVADGEVEVWARDRSGPLVGPLVRAFKRWVLRHPEHADVSMPSGCYQVGYQQDLEQEEIARVRD